MTVAELIAALEKVSRDYPVYVGSRDSRYVVTVESVEGNLIRINGLPERVLHSPGPQTNYQLPERPRKNRFVDKKPLPKRRRKIS